MRKRGLLSVMFVGVATALALLLLAGLAFAAPAAGTAADAPASSDVVPATAIGAAIRARRLISVPFGITSTQQLLSGGDQVQVKGHADCWDESRMFDIHVRLAQSSTQAFGEAHTIGICDQSVDQQPWTAVASAEGGQKSPTKFAAGPALACAQATEFGQHGVVDEHAWCKDVTLATSGY